MPIFDMCVMPDLNDKFGGASLNDHHWYPVEKSVCTRRFDFSMGSLSLPISQATSTQLSETLSRSGDCLCWAAMSCSIRSRSISSLISLLTSLGSSSICSSSAALFSALLNSSRRRCSTQLLTFLLWSRYRVMINFTPNHNMQQMIIRKLLHALIHEKKSYFREKNFRKTSSFFRLISSSFRFLSSSSSLATLSSSAILDSQPLVQLFKHSRTSE